MKYLLIAIITPIVFGCLNDESLIDKAEINDVISEWMVKLDYRINSNYSDNNALEEYYLRKWDTFAIWRFDLTGVDDLIWINNIIEASNPKGPIYQAFRFRRSLWSPLLIEIKGNIATVTYHLMSHYNSGPPIGGSLIANILSELVNCVLIREDGGMWKMKEVLFHTDFNYLLDYGGFPTWRT